MKAECSKCKSPNAWLRKTEYDLLVVCYCGYQKVLFTTLVDTLEGGLDDDEPEPETLLPRAGSNLHKTLVVLSILPDGTSAEITNRLNELNGLLKGPGLIVRKDMLLTVSDVSSYLTILRSKGLVERTEVKRGVAGGSHWQLTEQSIELLERE